MKIEILQVSFSNSCLDIELVAELKGHTNYVYQIVFLSDTQLASCAWDKTIKIWDFEDASVAYELQGHLGAIYCMVLLSNKKWLASGSADETIIIWDLETREIVRVLRGHGNVIFSLAALNDGNLASASKDNTIKIWNPYLKENNMLRTIAHKGVQHIFERLCILSSGFLNHVCYPGLAEYAAVMRVFNPTYGTLVKSIDIKRRSPVITLTMRNDDVAIGFKDGSVELYDLLTEKLTKTLDKCHQAAIASLAQLSDSFIITSGEKSDPTMKIWNIEDGTCVFNFQNGEFKKQKIAISDNSKFIAYAGVDNVIYIYDTTGNLSKKYKFFLNNSEKLNRRFKLVDEIGQGGFFRTYLVRDSVDKDTK